MRTPVTIGIVGLGSWGMTVARLMEELPQAELRYVYDTSSRTEPGLRALLGAGSVAPSLRAILEDETVDAVAVGVPSARRLEVARAVLLADKHLLVRPPVAQRREDGDELAALAAARQRRLTIAYRYRFSSAIQRLRELMDEGRLGELYYLDIVQHDPRSRTSDGNVLSSLGHEQIALICHLLADEPVDVTARGESYAEPGIIDVVHLSLRFATGILAHVHLSWLGPERTYRLTAVGAQRTVVIDEGLGERALAIHGNDGDVVTPLLPDEDPLRLACTHFLGLVAARRYDAVEGRQAGQVTGVLEALQGSLERGGSLETAPKRPGGLVVLPSH